MSKPSSPNTTSSDIVLIRGLPGSGKSHLGTRLAQERNVPFFDDCLDIPEVPAFVLTHPFLCQDDLFERSLNGVRQAHPDSSLDVISFENTPTLCLINAQKRAEKPVKGLISQLTRVYTPSGTVIPVWTPQKDNFS